MKLPELGVPVPDVLAELEDLGSRDVDWRRGRSWSLVYDSPDWHRSLVATAYARFADENALSHSAFPSAAEFESRVISMCASAASSLVFISWRIGMICAGVMAR